MNFEHRMYAGREILHVVSPSVAAFVDVGKATNGVLLRPSSFKTDVGIGLRLGLPRAPRNVLRVDFAYPLQRDFLGRRGMLISFSSGQAF
jgi:outer membrane translocation and assembly module TamA